MKYFIVFLVILNVVLAARTIIYQPFDLLQKIEENQRSIEEYTAKYVESAKKIAELTVKELLENNIKEVYNNFPINQEDSTIALELEEVSKNLERTVGDQETNIKHEENDTEALQSQKTEETTENIVYVLTEAPIHEKLKIYTNENNGLNIENIKKSAELIIERLVQHSRTIANGEQIGKQDDIIASVIRKNLVPKIKSPNDFDINIMNIKCEDDSCTTESYSKSYTNDDVKVTQENNEELINTVDLTKLIKYAAFSGDNCATGLLKVNGICIEIDY